jgi:hypothetical protein
MIRHLTKKAAYAEGVVLKEGFSREDAMARARAIASSLDCDCMGGDHELEDNVWAIYVVTDVRVSARVAESTTHG